MTKRQWDDYAIAYLHRECRLGNYVSADEVNKVTEIHIGSLIQKGVLFEPRKAVSMALRTGEVVSKERHDQECEKWIESHKSLESDLERYKQWYDYLLPFKECSATLEGELAKCSTQIHLVQDSTLNRRSCS